MAELTPPSATVLDAVIDLVRDVARQEVMPRFLNVTRHLKDDGTLLSEADLAAQQFLVERLHRIIDCPIIGEEMPAAAQRAAWDAGSDGVWCIDPIDGTTNFINGLPLFAISVAWLRQGQPRLGVTYNPVTDEMFSAREGGGAWFNGRQMPLRRSTTKLARGLANIDFKRTPKAIADRIAISPPFYSLRNFGSSTLEWAYLAAGRLDIYLHGGQMLWDWAAGRILLAEAGGQVCTLDSDDFDSAPPWPRPVVAALDPQVFAAWRDWLRQTTT